MSNMTNQADGLRPGGKQLRRAIILLPLSALLIVAAAILSLQEATVVWIASVVIGWAGLVCVALGLWSLGRGAWLRVG